MAASTSTSSNPSDGTGVSIASWRDDEFAIALSEAKDDKGWAYDWLYRQLGQPIALFAVGRGAADPEGITNDILLRVFRSLGDFDGDGPAFRVWVFTVARICLDEFDWARAEELDRPVWTRALSQLGPDSRDLVLLRLLAGLDPVQLGRVLSKPTSTIANLQRRGLRLLEAAIIAESTPTVASPPPRLLSDDELDRLLSGVAPADSGPDGSASGSHPVVAWFDDLRPGRHHDPVVPDPQLRALFGSGPDGPGPGLEPAAGAEAVMTSRFRSQRYEFDHGYRLDSGGPPLVIAAGADPHRPGRSRRQRMGAAWRPSKAKALTVFTAAGLAVGAGQALGAYELPVVGGSDAPFTGGPGPAGPTVTPVTTSAVTTSSAPTVGPGTTRASASTRLLPSPTGSGPGSGPATSDRTIRRSTSSVVRRTTSTARASTGSPASPTTSPATPSTVGTSTTTAPGSSATSSSATSSGTTVISTTASTTASTTVSNAVATARPTEVILDTDRDYAVPGQLAAGSWDATFTVNRACTVTVTGASGAPVPAVTPADAVVRFIVTSGDTVVIGAGCPGAYTRRTG